MSRKWKLLVLSVFVIGSIFSNQKNKDPTPSTVVTMIRAPDSSSEEISVAIMHNDSQQTSDTDIGFTIDFGPFLAFDYVFSDNKKQDNSTKKGKHK